MEYYKSSWLKKKLSYLFPFSLEVLQSEVSGTLEVCLNKGRLMLCAENAIYSYGDLYYNFTKIFLDFKFEQLQGKRVLVLGLGLGSIPFMLEKIFHQDLDYTMVEIDEDVIYLAEKYVLHELESSIQIIQADALVFTAVSKQKFDLICVDIFKDAAIPEEFQTVEFLQNLALMLNRDGVLLYNTLANDDTHLQLSEQYYNDVFHKTFLDSTSIKVANNLMLVSNKNYLSTDEAV
ncbi:MAG: fused MFS/spermidine synthase [Saprospiraceae bacterium]|nr:fused MFS/spermidine synthase [Saprospiraceae bacterium]